MKLQLMTWFVLIVSLGCRKNVSFHWDPPPQKPLPISHAINPSKIQGGLGSPPPPPFLSSFDSDLPFYFTGTIPESKNKYPRWMWDWPSPFDTIDPNQIQGGLGPPPPPPPPIPTPERDLPFYFTGTIPESKSKYPRWMWDWPSPSNSIDPNQIQGGLGSPPPPPPFLSSFDSDLPFYFTGTIPEPKSKYPRWIWDWPSPSNSIDPNQIQGGLGPPPPPPPIPTPERDLPFYFTGTIPESKSKYPRWMWDWPSSSDTIDPSTIQGGLGLPSPPPPADPSPPQIVERISRHQFQDVFPYTWTHKTFYQDKIDQNKITFSFRAYNQRGFNVNGLQKHNLRLTENDLHVRDYTLSLDSQTTGQGLDLVFAINNSKSMERDINMIRENIVGLIDVLNHSQLQANFCLLTFRDIIKPEDLCQEFILDDPFTPENENHVAFLDDVSKIQMLSSGRYEENALGALLAAAQRTPWQIGHQRLIVLATDALFWIGPFDNEKQSEASQAPKNYPYVLDVLDLTGVQVFTMTYDYGGFSRNYYEHPKSVAEATGGQWFDLNELRAGRLSIESIVDYMKQQSQTIYTIEYVAEENALDPFLPLGERQLDLTLLDDLGHQINQTEFKIQDVDSNMPEGKPHLQTRWPLNETQSLAQVWVDIDGQLTEDFVIDGSDLVFESPPDQGSQIHVQYEMGHLIDNVKWHPLVLPVDPKHKSDEITFSDVQLQLNGQVTTDFVIEPSSSGNFHLNLNRHVFSDEDVFGIRQAGGLEISLLYDIISQQEVYP